MKIDNSLELRFNDTLSKEGIDIRNITQGTEIKGFFRRMRTGESTHELKKLFSRLGVLECGDTIKIDNEYYVVLNRNNENSEVYCSCTIERCSEVWNIYGEEIHVVCKNGLQNPSPAISKLFENIDGALTCIVTDRKVIHKICKIDNVFMTFKGAYKIRNTFYDKGLAYIYFERTVVDTAEYTIETNDIQSIDINEVLTMDAIVSNGSYKVVSAVYAYQVDDNSKIAIDTTGRIIGCDNGTAVITITATYTLENGNGDTELRTTTKELTVKVGNTGTDTSEGGGTGETGGTEEPPKEESKGYVIFDDGLWSQYDDTWTIDTQGLEIYATCYDLNDSEIENSVAAWSFKLFDAEHNEISEDERNDYCRFEIQDDNSAKVYCTYSSYYGEYYAEITATFADGITGKLTMWVDK